MLELPLVKGDPFHHVLEAILDLSDVAHIVCTKRGLNLQAVETEGAALVALLLPAEDFKGYTCDEYISKGIPIVELVKAIRCGDDEDTITLKVGEENIETITLSFVSPEKNAVDYDLPLVDAELARSPLLDWQVLGLNYQGSVEMPSVEFSRICKYLSTFGEGDGVISVTKEELTFLAKGPIGHFYMEYKQPEHDTTIFNIDMLEPVTLTLDLKYLNTLAKLFTLSGQVKLSFSKTLPLVIECKIGEKGCIRCFLAQEETEFQGEEEGAQKEKGESEPQGEEDTDANKKTERNLPLRRRHRALQEASAATMLELPLVKGDPFHHVLEAILDLSDVALVECSRADLKLQAVDTERVAFVALLFPAEGFPGYICDQCISMGIPIRDLVKAILYGDKDAITLKVGKVGNETDTITVTLSFVSPEKNTAACDLRIMDAEIPHFKLPDWQDLESKCHAFVKMPSVEFRRICKYLSNFRDEDVGGISVTDKGLKFFAKGKSWRVNIKLEEDTTTFEINMQDPFTLTFNLKYFNTLAKVFTLSDQVKLCFSKTHLLVECKIGQKGYIRCLLATECQGEEEQETQKEEDINANEAPKMETELQGEDKDTQKEEDANANMKKKRKRERKRAKRNQISVLK